MKDLGLVVSLVVGRLGLIAIIVIVVAVPIL